MEISMILKTGLAHVGSAGVYPINEKAIFLRLGGESFRDDQF